MNRELADGHALRFLPQRAMQDKSLADMLTREKLDAVVLCWRNATRVRVNRMVRGHLELNGRPPQVGEPLVALRNYPPVYNGMRGLVTTEFAPLEDWWMLRGSLEFPDEGVEPTSHEICRDQFHRERPFDSLDDLEKAGIKVFSMSGAGHLYDFGYAITVHKSQGSQFKHVVVVADWRQDYSQENTRRLAYTAVTRAAERLTVLT